MTMLRQRIQELIEQHGSLRAAARVLMVDPGYLSRLASGEKDDPGEDLLRRMKMRRVVSYESTAGTGADTGRHGQDAHAGSPTPSEPVAWLRAGATLPEYGGYEVTFAGDPNGFPVVAAQSSKAALSDEEIIEHCAKAGVQWIVPDAEEGGFPGSFDMVTMDEMRAILSRAGIGESRHE